MKFGLLIIIYSIFYLAEISANGDVKCYSKIKLIDTCYKLIPISSLPKKVKIIDTFYRRKEYIMIKRKYIEELYFCSKDSSYCISIYQNSIGKVQNFSVIYFKKGYIFSFLKVAYDK